MNPSSALIPSPLPTSAVANMIRIFSIAVLASITLQGCMFAPGQNMDISKIVHAASPGGLQAELIPITPELIAASSVKDVRDSVSPELLSYAPGNYKIGANDLLFITVWDHPELTAPSGAQQQIDANGRLVRPDGTIYYPYIGNIKASGKTIEELRLFISERLSRFIESPQVDLSVLRFASQKIVIAGAVVKAGPIPITTTAISVVEAIGVAGVNTVDADLSNLTLTRDGHDYKLDLDALNNKSNELNHVYLKGGDQLYLPYNDRKRIYVMGEVAQPRALAFKTKTMNLSDVLSSVGGLNQNTSDGRAVYVIRGVENQHAEPTKIFQLDATSPSAMALATHFDVQAQDVVYVGPASVTRWNRFISQLLPSASIVGTGATVNSDVR